MHQGRIQQVGTPHELYDAPVNRFVASFIGTPAMGFLDCAIERRDGTVCLVSPQARIALDQAQALLLERAGGAASVTAGIRSEHLRLATTPAEPAEVVATGAVEVVEMLGAEQHVHVLVDGRMLAARVPRDQHVRTGDTARLVADSRRIHLFDRETGTALRGG
jgi:multiple sugar transport system ATP-binding protein